MVICFLKVTKGVVSGNTKIIFEKAEVGLSNVALNYSKDIL